MSTVEAVTFTERCRYLLAEQPDQLEFTVSRQGLETLVLNSERYAESNRTSCELLLTARDLASDTTMMTRDSDAWLDGSWDDQLPRALREIASGRLKTIEVQNRERGI